MFPPVFPLVLRFLNLRSVKLSGVMSNKTLLKKQYYKYRVSSLNTLETKDQVLSFTKTSYVAVVFLFVRQNCTLISC